MWESLDLEFRYIHHIVWTFHLQINICFDLCYPHFKLQRGLQKIKKYYTDGPTKMAKYCRSKFYTYCYVFTIDVCRNYTRYTTITITLIACWIFFSANNLFVSNNTCSLDLYSEDLQTKTVLFTRNASSHKTNCLLYLAFLLSYRKSRMFMFLLPWELYHDFIVVWYLVYIACCCVRILVYPLLSHTVASIFIAIFCLTELVSNIQY